MVTILILKREICPKPTCAQQLSSKVPACTYPSLRTELDHSSFSKTPRGKSEPTKLLGKGSLLAEQTPVYYPLS